MDVCFVLDLTASMGHIIDACKAHVAAIIRGLLSELEVGELRVAFVGYRDWGERNNAAHPRVVALPFVGHAGVEAFAERIGRESAHGGADMAEDVLSGMEAARDLEWRGDVRVCLFIADAPAHGWTGYDGLYGSDDFPDGCCPDQRGKSLPGVVLQLADDKGVDLIVCKLNDSTDHMERRCFAPAYPEEHKGSA